MYRKNEWDSDAPALRDGPLGDVASANTADAPIKRVISEVQAESRGPMPVQSRSAEAPAATPSVEAKPQRWSPRKVGAAALLAAAIIGGGWFGYDWWTIGRFTVSTDDAYVAAYNTTLAAKVSGYIAKVLVTDDQRVRAGDPIAIIDDGDYLLAADSAREKAATEEATIARIGHQIDSQEAAVAQAKAQVVSAQAAATRAELELVRQTTLAAKDFASHQTLEQAQANRDQAVAAVAAAQAAVASAIANVAVLKGQQQEAAKTLDELKTALAKAERDLSFTTIRAPMDGVIGNRAVQVGDYVQPGQRLASLVPLDAIYVAANFKETQLAGLRPGQTASIAIDALPEHAIEGIVESYAAASGAVFSLLPPDNATGNFTKIVQRFPVRIHVPESVAAQGLLRPGMSVVVSVNTKAQAPAANPAKTAAR